MNTHFPQLSGPAPVKILWASPTTGVRSTSRGFSIVEMMIALVLIAVGAALALPSYQNMIEKRQLTRGAEKLLAFVNAAQSRSIQWNEQLNVSWSRTGDNQWCVGANLGETVCNCTDTDPTSATYCAINNAQWHFDDEITGDRVLLKSFSGDNGGDNSYSFDPDRGLFVNLLDSLDVELHSKNQNYQLRLQVSNTGAASLCSKDAEHAIPGYSVCQAVEIAEEVDVEVAEAGD
jgi:type IV fimbrial biogenesis protein FimT